MVLVSKVCRGGEGGGKGKGDETDGGNAQLSLVALLLAAIRRSMVSCRVDHREEPAVTLQPMEIGWPTNVQHIAHVTFDRFNGFLGLPVEFQLEIPRKVPSASASVFGVSAESMQCSYDSKGNSVPTILLLMQEQLYSQGGLKAEGIFRINPENSKEEHVRDQLNKGIVPEDIDVHCLAGLIKAWFRELPAGVLDGLSPEQVLQCNTEDECTELVKLLLPTQAALLHWAVELMADVVEEEGTNKMNARNIAMVFAPNMTQMADPLTALMHAVQVMNLLKTLILRTLRERRETTTGGSSPFSLRDQEVDDDDDFDSQQDLGMSCELGGPTSDDEHVIYSPCCGDGGDFLNDIEECFLRQLEDNEEDTTDDDSEKLVRNPGGNHDSSSNSFGDQAQRQVNLSGPDINAESVVLLSGSKYGISSISKEEEGEEDLFEDIANRKTALKEGSDGKEIEMADAELESLPCCSPSPTRCVGS